MQFHVYSRSTIEAIEPHDVPHIIVSISTPDDKPAKFNTNEHTLGVLRLWFHDLDTIVPIVGDGAITEDEKRDMFQREDAWQILTFVADHPTAQAVIVHCDAGWSRSPGVAAALSKIYTGDDARFFKQYCPNMRVYRMILDEHYGPTLRE